MSFDSSHARDRSQTQQLPAVIPMPPGKRGGTDRLSAPAAQAAPVARASDQDGASSTLSGTGWLSGVLGFGGDELCGEVTTTTMATASGDADPTAESVTSVGGDSETSEETHGDSQESAGGDVDGDVEVAEGRTDAPVGHKPAKHRPIKVTHKTLFHAPGGAANTRTTVGVGETVELHATEAGSWSANHGTRHGASSKFFFWTAPEKAGTTTISFHHKNKTIHKKLHVIAPNTLAMRVATTDSIKKGTMGAGMITNVTIGPLSVSFGNVEWLEVPGGPSSVSGYFKDHGAPSHHPNPSWLQWNSQNTGLNDHASISGYPKPWYPGTFTWYIPNKYRVASVGGSGHVFIRTHQVFRITDKKGTTTVTKGGAGVTRTP